MFLCEAAECKPQHSMTKCFMKNRIKDAWMAINLPQYLMQGYWYNDTFI